MSIHRWPDTLPSPSAPGFGLSPVDQSIRTNMEIGAQRVRRRTNARFDRVTMNWFFTPYEMDAFRIWHDSLAFSSLGSSDDLSIWTLLNLTRNVGGATGPDGTVVDRVMETVTSANHYLSATVAALAVDSTVVQFTATIKGLSRNFGRLIIIGRDSVVDYTEFDLTAGTMAAQSGLTSRTILDRTGGWWRVAITADIGIGPASPIFRIQLRDDSGNLSYAGDVAKGFRIAEVAARLVTGSDLFIPTDTAGTAAGADGGSAWFYTPLVQGSTVVSREARFLGPYKATAMAGLNWSVTAEVEVRNV